MVPSFLLLIEEKKAKEDQGGFGRQRILAGYMQLDTKKIGAKDVYMTESSDYNGRNFSYNLIYVSWNFLRTMGIHIVDGRDFTEADARSDRLAFIFNDHARRSLQMSVGPFKYWRDNLGDLVGFTGDLHIASLRQESTNICLAASPLGSRLPSLTSA